MQVKKKIIEFNLIVTFFNKCNFIPRTCTRMHIMIIFFLNRYAKESGNYKIQIGLYIYIFLNKFKHDFQMEF